MNLIASSKLEQAAPNDNHWLHCFLEVKEHLELQEQQEEEEEEAAYSLATKRNQTRSLANRNFRPARNNLAINGPPHSCSRAYFTKR